MDATEIVLPGLVEPDGMLLRHRHLPEPQSGQARVRVEATGVSFAEQQMRRGKYFDQPAFPFVPGYDLVGTVEQVGSAQDAHLIGQRVAAVTKIGAWSNRLNVDVADLLAIQSPLEPATILASVVNGITAWQLLRRAQVAPGGTIVVLGANGGVGTMLTQLGRARGLTIIGTSSMRHHDALRSLGALPVNRHSETMYDDIRALAPQGVDAVFDNVGGPDLSHSWKLLRRGGALLSYGSAATKNASGNSRAPLYRIFFQVAGWNLAPNGRHAHLYNFWAGRRRREGFRDRLHEDLAAVLHLIEEGAVSPLIAARFPLRDAAKALTLAESHTVLGKIVLLPEE